MPKICNYYVSLECNDTCEFCPIWRKDKGTGLGEEEKAMGEAKELFESLKKQGVVQLNITGGEPLLRSDLPQLLQQAKDLKFQIRLYTNGILYAEKAKKLAGLANEIYFSLDYPFAQMHDDSRGVECFHQVVQAIKLARELGEKPIINFTMTRDSVLYLPDMVDLAEKFKVPVYLNPVYDHYGLQGFEDATIRHIKYFWRHKLVLFNLAVLEFVKAKGNKTILPRCRAKETTITILPNGDKVSPCFFNQKGQQGRADVCSNCMRWDYLVPSFLRGFDKYYCLNITSNVVKKVKLGLRQ